MSYLSLLYSGEDEETIRNVYSILKHLTLYDFYEKLGSELVKDLKQTQDIEINCRYCKDNIASAEKNGDELIKLCKKICNIILNVNGVLDKCKNNTADKPCQYMSYWLYNKIMSIIDNTPLVRNFYAAVTIYSGTHSHKFRNCTLTNFKIDKDKFDIKRTLYEFIEIYDGIKNEISDENNVNVKTYCKHIKENFRFFNSINEECINQNSCGYYDEYKQFKEKVSNTEDLKLICEKCDYEKTSCEQGISGEGDVPCLREKGNSFIYLIFGNDPEDVIQVLLKVTTISVPILAFFVILFKFTPLRKSLNKLKQERKKSGRKKKEENTQDYMKNYAAYLDSEMKNRVHLTYHAT